MLLTLAVVQTATVDVGGEQRRRRRQGYLEPLGEVEGRAAVAGLVELELRRRRRGKVGTLPA